MDKKFRNLVLTHVERILKEKPPGREGLFSLLLLAEPELKPGEVDHKAKRESAFRALKILIHPDKHRGGTPEECRRVTKLFQEAQDYYSSCLPRLTLPPTPQKIQPPQQRPATPPQRAKKQPTTTVTTTTTKTTKTTTNRTAAAPPSSTTYSYVAPTTTKTKTTSTTNRTAAAPSKTTNYAYVGNTKHSPKPSPNNTPARSRGRTHSPPRSKQPQPNYTNQYHQPLQKNAAGQTVVVIPRNFNAVDKWPYLNIMMHVPPKGQGLSRAELAWTMACRCINLRGAVAHGQKCGRAYQVTKKANEMNAISTVEAVFQHFGFHRIVRLGGANDMSKIKKEIFLYGPVVSTSFTLTKAFFVGNKKFADHFSHIQQDSLHPVILMGWSMNATGEVWKVHSLRLSTTLDIGTGQFEITKTCLAPAHKVLQTIPWQSSGPFLDLNMPDTFNEGADKDWRDLKHMCMGIRADELDVLGNILKPLGFQAAIAEKKSFVIRDKHRQAYSRRYVLRELTPDDVKNGKWKLSVTKVDDDNSYGPPAPRPSF